MKAWIVFFTLFASLSANAASIIENKPYKEVYLNFENSEHVSLTVQGERYRGTRARTLVTINQVSDGLYVVDQENLYYPAVVVYPPLPTITLRDSASVVVDKGEHWAVRVLVPANLQIIATDIQDINGPVCMAYWTGFVYSAESDSCIEKGASGCGNPFEFTSLESCEQGNLLQ